MVALAILAAGLAVLAHSQTLSLRAVSRAKMLTITTQLARARMVEIEDELKKEGFPQFETEEEEGDFSDDGFANVRWHEKIEKIELPGALDLQALAATQGGAGAGGGTAPAAGGAGATGGLADMFGVAASVVAGSFDLIRNILEDSIRKVTLTVTWKEGAREQSLTVQAYFTDPTRIDAAAGIAPAAAPGGVPGVGPAGGVGRR